MPARPRLRDAGVAGTVDLLIKVKGTAGAGVPADAPGLILFTYLHLAPLPELTRALLDSQTNAIATKRCGGGRVTAALMR
jgi:alanine dehydrogenase